MGQRNAIMMMLLSGGMVFAVIVMGVLAASLGTAAVPAGVAGMWLGLIGLIVAKWPVLRNGDLLAFGPGNLSQSGRALYWSSYGLMGCALFLTLFGLSLR